MNAQGHAIADPRAPRTFRKVVGGGEMNYQNLPV
jgi:hypothetical protein